MDRIDADQTQLIDTESRFLDTNGFRVHFKRFGTGRTLIVLLHGSFLSLRSWRHVARPLAEQATLVAFDRPVCGLTSRPLPGKESASLYSADAQSDLVVAIIQELGFDQAVLIGNSTGGTIALLTALRHPDKVQALVLVGAMVYSGYATSELPGPMRALMSTLKPVFSGLMRLMITRLYDKAIRKFWYHQERLSDELLAAYKADFMVGPWDKAFLESFLETRHLGLATRLASVSIPSLVVTGEHDRAVKPEESRRLAQDLPGAEFRVIPDCGHLPQEETPDAFVALVKDFLSGPR